MNEVRPPIQTFAWTVIAALAVLGSAGCQTIDFYDQSLETPVSLEQEPPRELSMVSMPAYRIEPPDVLQLEMLKQVPLPPYRTEAYDVLRIQVVGALADYPINDHYLVEAEGTVILGPYYGSVRVIGMTIDEIEKVIDKHLRQFLAEPVVSAQLARSSGTQPITGEYLVGPDGTINLRQYGSVHLAGKTLAESKALIEKHLSQYFDSPEVSLNILAFNSKVYYIITAGAGTGDNIVRIPFTGNETVLDAITQVGGLSQVSTKNLWIARPAPDGFGYEQILTVDWDAITQGGGTATNYQIMPDDRIFVADNSTIALTTFINKVTAPLERLLGIGSFGVSTARSMQTMGRSYNLNRR